MTAYLHSGQLVHHLDDVPVLYAVIIPTREPCRMSSIQSMLTIASYSSPHFHRATYKPVGMLLEVKLVVYMIFLT